MSTLTPEAASQYAHDVINALAADFTGLRNAVDAEVVREAVEDHAREGRLIEVIVDSPYFANWRLVPDPEHPGRVRIGCWRQRPLNDRYQERLDRINEALQAIPMEVQR